MVSIRCMIVLSTSFLLASGCASGPGSQEISSSRMDDMHRSFGTYFTYMSDNALLHDMSLTDVHFVPHTTEISGVGEARLERMAKLLNVYGGIVRYEPRESDQNIVEERMEHVREYLALVGCNMERVEVAVMRSGGRGGPALEAVQAYRASMGVGEGNSRSSGTASLPGLTGSPNGR